MWNNEDILKEFHYYNEEGVFIGKSEGTTPQQDLFDKAHYVFDDESEIIKNQDLLILAKRRLKNLRNELLGIPMKDITRIMDVNQDIKQLERKIEDLKSRGLKEAS